MPLYRKTTRLGNRLRLRVSGTPRDRFLDVERLLWVSPSCIEYKTLLPGSALRNRGCGWVLDGDWDELKHPFVNDVRYRAVRDVLENARSWQETEEYAGAVAALDKGGTVWHCRTRSELDERYRLLDRLVESIRRDGYRTQSELRHGRSEEAALGRGDEIAVAIGRHGDVLYRDGAHRLAIAKLLAVPRVPVQVVVRHAEWAAFRKELEQHAAANGGLAPQPLLHADLENIPTRTSCVARHETLTASLPQTTRSIIDFSPGWGYFCQRLSSEGFACLAVAQSGEPGIFLEKLRRASAGDFTIAAAEAIPNGSESGHEFDLGLMLDNGLPPSHTPPAAALLGLLASVEVHELLVEPRAFNRHWGEAANEAASCRELLEALLEGGRFAHCDLLATSHEAGPLYRLH